MDKILLKQKAEALEDLLRKYAVVDSEAKSVLEGVKQLLRKAKEQTIDLPRGWGEIPGRYYFDEGALRKYRDLEHAYAEFCIEITGGETPALKKMRERGLKKDI